MGFFNFGNNDKEKPKLVYLPEEKKMAYVQQENPYTENGLVLKRVPVEKGIMKPGERDNSDLSGLRSIKIGGLFGTTDLDYILRAYAPDTIDTLDSVIHNQKKISNDISALKKQNQELKEMLNKLLQEKGLSNNITK
ncbi:MAG: hypothetical protein E7198_04265 [Schwartzia succinivorans]|uniref:hypothetical protein n=1 Tax=Schwartzia succinivorans TaxID=55507 RepID=UPI0023521EED|nr:hypothetical protein [Schwartzia succinivorans]MBE6096998.1 hypothetical protein [Schwartzia succinivorans]